MSNAIAIVLAGLVFALVLSVWNWVTGMLPGSPSGGLEWIMLLVAAITAIVVYLAVVRR